MFLFSQQLYSETAERPLLPKETLELVITVGLFLLNTTVIIIFALACVAYYWGVEMKSLRCKKSKQMRRVVNETVVARELAWRDDDDTEVPLQSFFWRNPTTGVAQEEPPSQISNADGSLHGFWCWVDANQNVTFAAHEPELIVAVADGEVPAPGDFVCTLYEKSMKVSTLLEVPPDVGGRKLCGCTDEEVVGEDDEKEEDEGAPAEEPAADGGIAMSDNPLPKQIRENAPAAEEGFIMSDNPLAKRIRDEALAWKEYVSTSTGHTYWTNSTTGESVYSIPAGVVHSDGVERRNADDGVAYTKAQFLEHYGIDEGEKMWAEGETRRIVAAQHAEAAVVPEADNATSASGSDSSSDADRELMPKPRALMPPRALIQAPTRMEISR